MKRLFAASMFASGIVAATPAAAQLVSAANPESVAAALRDKGYQAELTKGTDGDPLIRSGAEGAKFTVFFYGCTAGSKCQTIQCYAGFEDPKVDLAKINEWNQKRRFGRAYIDKDDDAVIEMDVDLDDGGMSRALFEDNFEFWTSVLGTYRTYVYE